ncbi:tyrosine-type recombinase/integrase [Sphingomonas sp. MMS12-HWE2-04]|uniref:tyrosine-type recombinase/integrase n=1 Tax=Sphingomonas sp. MMS12-HWE2-04 TaxID=3234199 RepID=UPI00384CFBE0
MEHRNALTQALIENLQAGQMTDPKTPGLYIEAKRSRGQIRRAWKYRRRIAGQSSKSALKLTLGSYPAYSIAAAREWAATLNLSAEQGLDPVQVARVERAGHLTVADAHALYMASVRKGEHRTLKPRSISGKEYIWTGDIRDQLGARILQELTDDDLWSLVLAKGKTAPIRANRLAAELKVFFKWCAGRPGKVAGVILKTNPAVTLEANYFRSKPRSRHLSHEELGWLLTAVAEEKRIYQRAVLLLLLTGCRKEEVLGASAGEVRDGIWSIAPERTKNSQTHRLALGPWGRSLLATNRAWLIPSSRKDGPMLAGWYKVLARIRARMELAAGCPVAHFTFHDLRRTLRSNTKRLKIDLETAEAMLNHKKTGLEEVYDGYDLFDEKREGFERWENLLIGFAASAGLCDALSIPDESRPSFDELPGRPSSPQLPLA